jgi:hypothetical protein
MATPSILRYVRHTDTPPVYGRFVDLKGMQARSIYVKACTVVLVNRYQVVFEKRTIRNDPLFLSITTNPVSFLLFSADPDIPYGFWR